eukprot:scaffold35707_cov176-Amphora_coffeaeformis.AAC.1
MPRARDNDDNDDYHKNNDLVPYTNMRRLKESYDNPLIPGLMGVALGGALVAMGVALGGKRN